MINTQKELDNVTDEQYLANVFKKVATVYIQTRNAQWRNDFYLPTIQPPKDVILKTHFDVQSDWPIHVYFHGKSKTFSRGSMETFTNVNGRWYQQGKTRLGCLQPLSFVEKKHSELKFTIL